MQLHLLFQTAIPLSDQLEHFKEYIGKLKGAVGEERTNKILRDSLHLVVAGSDDLANTYFSVGIRRAQYDISSYADLVVSSASSFIQVQDNYLLSENGTQVNEKLLLICKPWIIIIKAKSPTPPHLYSNQF